MLSKLFKKLIPTLCIALTSFSMPAQAQVYGNGDDQCCEPCEPCETPCCSRGWFRDAAIFVGAAAVGAIAGVIAGNSSGHRGRHGDPGLPGPAGAGFSIATVPVGQPGAGTPVTSLIFTFTTDAAISVDGGAFQAYVTTPDGRTILGTTFTGLLGSTATVTIPTGPFFAGVYEVGIIAPAGLTTLAGLVSAEVTNINGAAVSPALDDAGIVVAATLLGDTTFFNAGYPFPQVP